MRPYPTASYGLKYFGRMKSSMICSSVFFVCCARYFACNHVRTHGEDHLHLALHAAPELGSDEITGPYATGAAIPHASMVATCFELF